MPKSAHHLWEDREITIAQQYSSTADVTLYHGDCKDLLRTIPDQSCHLVVTSPPCNMGSQ